MTQMTDSTPTGLSRRDFLGAAAALAAGAAAAVTASEKAYAVEDGVIGDWRSDGTGTPNIPDSATGNASSDDGTYRDHTAAAFPAPS